MCIALDGLNSQGQSVSFRMKGEYKFKENNDYNSHDEGLPP